MTGTDTRFYRNGILVNSPRNWKELEVECDWLDRRENQSMNVPSLNFVGEEATNIRTRILDGISGGYGIFEGDKMQIEFGDVSNPVFKFQGYLDYVSESTYIGENEVRVSVKKEQGVDWLNDVADGFSFASLFDEGIVKNSDFVKVPYVINYIPDSMQLIMLSLYSYTLAKEIAENIARIVESIAEVTNASIPSVGAGVGLGAVAVTTWDLGDIIWVALKVAMRIAYTIALGYALYKTLQELIEQLLPKKRNHLGMSVKTMFQRACDRLDLKLSSTLLNSIKDWVIIPSKFAKGEEPAKGEVETGYPTNTDPIYTFGDLIRICSKWFNAEYRINNGIFQFEQEIYWKDKSSFVIPMTYDDQEKMQNILDFNTEQSFANYVLSYGFDGEDQNTLDNQEGRIFQVIAEPKIVKEKKYVNIKGLVEIQIPFSMGLEKKKLTVIETVLKDLLSGVDGFLSIIGKSSNLKSKITNRLDCLLLSSHFTAMPKVVVMNGSKLKTDQRKLLSCRNLFDTYHFSKSFAEYKGHHNQWRKFPERTIPFSKEDFVLLGESNYCTLSTGEEARIDYLKWNPYRGTAVIKGRVKYIYTNNLKLREIE